MRLVPWRSSSSLPGRALSRCSGTVPSRRALVAGGAGGQALALIAVLLVVRAVGPERAGLAPARRRGWLAPGGGLAALVVNTAAIRGTLARRPRSRPWIVRELAAVDELNPDGKLETALYVPVALQAAALERADLLRLGARRAGVGRVAHAAHARPAPALRARESLPGATPRRDDNGDPFCSGRGGTGEPVDPSRDRAARRA